MMYTSMIKSVESSLVTLLGERAPLQYRSDLRHDKQLGVVRKIGHITTHELIRRMPNLATRILGSNRVTQDFTVIGEGFDAIVIKEHTSPDVQKIHWRSAQLSKDAKTHEAETRQELFAIMAANLGGLTLPQITEVDYSAVFPDISIVMTKQPFIPHKAADILSGGHLAGMERLCSEVQNAPAALTALIEGSNWLYDKYGLVPDSGGDNLVITEGALRLIDGHPITADYPMAQGDTLRNLDRLAGSLQLLTA